MDRNEEKANVLLESLKYIKKFHNQTVLIKYGGNAMSNEKLKESVIKDISLLKYVGMNPVIVHGGGPDISKAMNVYGIEPEFIDGQRVTDDETMEITQMVLAGKLGPSLVSYFEANDVQAVAINGKDGNMIEADQIDPDLGYAGKVTNINTSLIETLVRNDYVPVITSVAIGEDGNSYNVNADVVAGHIARALNAYKMIMITDVDGVLKDKDDPSSIIRRFSLEEGEKYIEDGTISGGMIPKVRSCMMAVAGGVHRAHIINGTRPHAILLELFTDNGIGTMIKA